MFFKPIVNKPTSYIAQILKGTKYLTKISLHSWSMYLPSNIWPILGKKNLWYSSDIDDSFFEN